MKDVIKSTSTICMNPIQLICKRLLRIQTFDLLIMLSVLIQNKLHMLMDQRHLYILIRVITVN